MSPNLRAFLDMVAWSEIGTAMLARSDNGYNVCVGSRPDHMILFEDYSQHPRRRFDALNSDAAGRYQFLGRYWLQYKKLLGLPDFGPLSQDRWAIQLIGECHALDAVAAGDIRAAITRCSSRWASLPGAGYGQPEHTVDELVQVYLKAGGATNSPSPSIPPERRHA